MKSQYSEKTLKKIRKEVLDGKTKYQVAKEMGLSDKVVYYHTRDIPSKNPGRTEIRGRTLEVLKTLLTEGFVDSNTKNSGNLRILQKHFKPIKRSQVNGKKTVYYLEDKNKKALKSIIENKGSKVISYHELASMSQVFDVNLSKKEKHRLVGRKQDKSSLKKHSSDSDSTGEMGGFLGRFLHSELLRQLVEKYASKTFIYHMLYIPTKFPRGYNELSYKIRHKRTFGNSKRIPRNP